MAIIPPPSDHVATSTMERGPIDPSRYTRSIRARRLRGAAALMEALALIGATNATDHDLAHVICENELELREFLSGALLKLSQSGDVE